MTLVTTKSTKSKKPQYPEYLSLDILDSVIKNGANPMEMMASMKKAILERVMGSELNHHLEHDKGRETMMVTIEMAMVLKQ